MPALSVIARGDRKGPIDAEGRFVASLRSPRRLKDFMVRCRTPYRQGLEGPPITDPGLMSTALADHDAT